MARYKVKNGYCLHLPNGKFFMGGSVVDLDPETETRMLAEQGWKIEAIHETKPQPQTKDIDKPPVDRAIKKPQSKKTE